jgi:hypothetical protein
MKLTTVLSSVNNNRNYYKFIPKQILFWKHFNIRFIAIFVGDKIPEELSTYSDNIILWNKNTGLNSAFVAQNLRMYYPALLHLPEDEFVMITDMDMLPMNDNYYKSGLEEYTIDDFVYYRNVDDRQIYMCYNAAHPSLWAKLFKIYSESDIELQIQNTYDNSYDGIPGSTGWFIDQKIMYKVLINYPQLKVLNRSIIRLEMYIYEEHLQNGDTNFIQKYDDAHFHRDYHANEHYILNAESQL